MKYILPLVSSLFFNLIIYADVTISMVHDTNGKVVDTTLSFAGERVRMDSPQGGVIITPSQDQVIMLMHPQQQYMQRSLKQMAAMNQSHADVLEKITFEQTGQQELINGYACEQVIGTGADGDVTEFWVSKDSIHTDKFLDSMQAFNQLQHNGQSNHQMDAWNQFFKSNPELSTFPIRTIHKNTAGVVQSMTTVQSMSEDRIPESRFEVPAGYKKLTIPDGGTGAVVTPQPGEAKPAAPNPSHTEVLKELQALQQEIQQSGGRPTPEQMQRLQELATRYQVQ
ncbi:MAG: DUF4412 domain-containing protein [Verrucomicrobiota bacterium]